MKFARFVCPFVLFAITTVLAQSNPVPFVNQPLVPTAVAPGGPGFTLTVNGTGFVSTSTLNWNGTPLTTTFVSSSRLTATVPASNIAQASTASITVSNPSPGGGTSGVVFFAVSAPTTLQFTSLPATAANGCAPCFNLITADFNRDGELDLTFDVFYIGPALTTSLGNGDGTFQGALGAVFGFDFSVAADFNGDGKLDMAGIEQSFGPYQPYGAYIALGNGDGTFSPGSTIASGNQSDDLTAFQIAAADFNGDGKLDVAIGDDLGIEVYLGNGDGTFQAGLLPVGGGVVYGQTVGDFNGDGILDIAEIVGTSNLQLQILLGKGDGTFQTGTSYPGFSSSAPLIFAADVNGDTKLDLVILQTADSSQGGGTVTVLLGNGDGTFGSPTNYAISGSLGGGALADFNADGKLDVMLSTSTDTVPSTTIMLGNGDGTFQSPLVLPIPANGSVAAGDFNNDGKLDLAVAVDTTGVNGVFVLLQEVPQPELSPSSITFAPQLVGTASSPQSVTLTNANTGTAPMTIKSIAIRGANSHDFSQTNNCPANLVVGADCQINITFTPIAAGVRNASLAVADNAPGSPQSIPLSGTGTNPVPVPYLSPANVTFPGQYVGTSGLPQSVTLNNPGAELVIISVKATPADFAPLSTCGNMIAPGGSCSIGVFFDPTTSGTRTGTLTVTDDASNSPQTASLTGVGQDFSVAPGSQATATVSPGQAASYKVAVAPDGGFNQTVTLSCSGAPPQSTCTVSPSSVKPSGSAVTATVTVTTAGSSAGLTQPITGPGGNIFEWWLALSGTLGLAMLASLAGWRRERRPTLLYGLAFLCLLSIGVTMSACGGGSSGNGGGGGTQAGTYNLTVTGSFTSGSTTLTHNTKLTLIVQ